MHGSGRADPVLAAHLPCDRACREVLVGQSVIPTRRLKGGVNVSQRNVEVLIGRLITDEAFREMFLRDSMATLTRFVEWGYELTRVEIAALEATDPALWARTAEHIDPRLQKVFSGSR